MKTLSKTRHGQNILNNMRNRILFHVGRGRTAVDICTLEGWHMANVRKVMEDLKAEGLIK